jgi:ABC-type Fe3+ transport system permease subunit
MTQRRDRFLNTLLPAIPSVVVVGLCCALPLGWIVLILITNPSIGADIHLSSFRLDLLERTLGYNFGAALIATAMGLPAGFVLGRGRGMLARVLWFVVPAALFMPSLAFAYGWAELVRSAAWLYRPLRITFFPGSPSDIFRCIWTLAAWLWAVPACIIGLSLRRMETSVEQQAALEGALFRTRLRQLLGPVIISLATVTILATQEFSVYEPTGISVVATEVRMVFDTGAFSSLSNPIAGPVTTQGVASPDQQGRAAVAIATALPLLGVTFLLALLATGLARRVASGDELAVGSWPRVLDAGRWAKLLTVLLLLVNIVLPIVMLFARLHARISPQKIWEEFSPKVLGSILVGAVAATSGVVLTLSASARWTRGLLVLSCLSFLIGGQILAISLIRISNRPHLIWAYDTLALPVAAYVGRFGWLALASARVTWSKPWRELREMASLDGASPFRVALNIIWPLAWPALVAGCIFMGALSLTEVPATVLISPQNPQVLTPMLMTWVHSARFDPMIEASLLMVFIVLVPVAIAMPLVWLARYRFRRRSKLLPQMGHR